MKVPDEIAIRVAIAHGDKVIKSDTGNIYGSEKLLLTVGVVRKGNEISAHVDGIKVSLERYNIKPRSVEKVANELFKRFTQERNIPLS